MQLAFLTKKEQKLLYYRAEVDDIGSTKTPSIKTLYLQQNAATSALKFEPWILDTANSLSQVNGCQKITFGDGATLKTDIKVQCKKHGIHVPMSSEVAFRNFWLTMITFQSGVLKVPCQIFFVNFFQSRMRQSLNK